MSPAILDSSEGELYFGTRPLSAAMTDFAINEGIVGYTHSLAEAKANDRAGRNPLQVRAKRVDSDARMLVGAEQSAKIFSNAKVIFILQIPDRSAAVRSPPPRPAGHAPSGRGDRFCVAGMPIPGGAARVAEAAPRHRCLLLGWSLV